MVGIEWWHWIVVGVGLVLLELVIPAFFVMWFGLAAVFVGAVLWLVPAMSVTTQVGLWILFSVVTILLWFKVFKVHRHRTRVGMSEGQFTGEVGLTTRAIKPYQNGQIRFQKPILGSDLWEAMASEEIAAGERVQVLSVEGNILRVARVG